MDIQGHGTWMERGRQWALGVPVRVKIFGIGVGLVVVLSAQMIWHVRNTCRVTMEQQLRRQTQTLLTDIPALAPGFFSSADPTRLQALLADLLERHPELMALDVLDARGGMITHASAGTPPFFKRAALEITAPVRAGQPGGLRAVVSTHMIQDHVNQLTRQMLFIAALLALLGIGAAWVLTQIIVRPIRELVRAALEVRRGHLTVRARHYADDELGQLTKAFNDMTQSLEEKEAIRTHLIQQVMSAHEEERARVAQELHDELGQSLTSIVLGLKSLEGKVADHCAALCRELRDVAVRTMEAAHDLAMTLRPSALRDLGLAAALEHQATCCMKRFGITVDVATIGIDRQERFPESMEVAFYRIVQEALTNSVKHGRARAVSIVLQRRQEAILVTIEDDGCGFDSVDWRLRSVEQKRLGLLGMEERIQALDGVLTVESQPQGGTTIYAEVPLAVPALVS